jgi:hypothetical protein
MVQQHFPLARALCQQGGLQSQLGVAMDWSTHIFVQQRLLAQKLLERSSAAKVVMDALAGTDANREAALIVLQHCCKLNSQLSQFYVKAGLIWKLLNLATSGISDVEKVGASIDLVAFDK